MAAGLGHGGGDAVDGEGELVDRVGGVAGRVLDRAADQAAPGRQADRLGAGLGRAAEAVLEVGGNGQVGGADDGLGVGQDRVAAERGRRVAQADRESEAGAGGGEGGEAESRQDAGRAGIPGVGHDEGAWAFVERLEALEFFVLAGHLGTLHDSGLCFWHLQKDASGPMCGCPLRCKDSFDGRSM